MKKLLFFTLVFLGAHLGAQDFNFTLSGKQYKLVKTKKTWVNAAAWAVQDGGYLVEINSSAEQMGIRNAIAASGISTTYTVVNDGGGIAYIWIGATDKDTEGTWIWDGDNDGQGINFYNGQGAWGNGNGTVVNGLYNSWGGTNTGTNNEPDNYGNIQDAAGIGLEAWPAAGSGNLAGEWNDISMSNQLYFIVEYESIGFNDVLIKAPDYGFTVQHSSTKEINIISSSPIQKLEIFDMTGKQVYIAIDVFLNNVTINNLPSSGVFFIRAYYPDAVIRSKKVLIL